MDILEQESSLQPPAQTDLARLVTTHSLTSHMQLTALQKLDIEWIPQ